ncbi:MAG: pantoate--beta-alanine ligase [Candidatus Margulisbacteria bacterium]|nr:pantoate--beta-alanine ligase [Candidatus Margulisiibacteriota bacterium]
MRVIFSPDDFQSIYIKSLHSCSIGFIPTMGYLHEGHLSLIRQSRKENDITIASIYVNPLQFGPREDLQKYPRDLDRDKKLLQAEKVDFLFYPGDKDMYPEKLSTIVHVEERLAGKLCGQFRPGHFDGVATVVLKLFNIIKPNKAYLGLKDYQQYIIIKKMVNDFNLDVRIIGMPTVREKNGLAMSSRNSYLSTTEKQLAGSVYSGLLYIQEQLQNDMEINIKKLTADYINFLSRKSEFFKLQYLEIYDLGLKPIKKYKKNKTVIAAAVFFKNLRLIDNIII